jgi:hypothetical protein
VGVYFSAGTSSSRETGGRPALVLVPVSEADPEQADKGEREEDGGLPGGDREGGGGEIRFEMIYPPDQVEEDGYTSTRI